MLGIRYPHAFLDAYRKEAAKGVVTESGAKRREREDEQIVMEEVAPKAAANTSYLYHLA
jgi:hypothetical protein